MKKAKIPSNERSRGRPSQTVRLLPRLKVMGVFRIQDAKRIGVSQSTLSRLAASGLITKLGGGLYEHPEATILPEERDYVIACARLGPGSVVGGLTALYHYQLVEQVPLRIWMMVPSSQKTNDPIYRCIRTKTNPRMGIDDRGAYRITNLERTLVEAFRYASKMGLRVAMRATRTALADQRTTLAQIHRQAKALGFEKFIERYWETLVPESGAA